MYIKSIVLEGFKSYAQRTEVKDFDPEFNAITGLNGSGKSNILDAICFVLGISNLHHVRALNLNELVYKNGQAGVNKATVSVTFDNSNKEQSPIGYSENKEIVITRQISIGNRNKYLINGHVATNQRLHDLFRSVQLNINNPHFLIMQGCITKVLNMKPDEILSMVEEATGTRLYENKKEASFKIIAKKNSKLLDVDKQINEELTPYLMKLKEDREAYIKYQEINRELEYLQKYHLAFSYYGQESTLEGLRDELARMQEKSNNAKNDIKMNENEVVAVKKALEELENNKDNDLGGKLEKMKKDLEGCKVEEARVSSELEASKKLLKNNEKELDNLKSQIRKDVASMHDKENLLKELDENIKSFEETVRDKKEALNNSIKNLQAVKTGSVTSEEGKAQSSLQENLRAARIQISNSETLIQETTSKLKHTKEELKKQESTVKKQDASYKNELAAIEKLSDTVKSLEASLKKLNFSKERHDEVLKEHRQLEGQVYELNRSMQALQASLHQLQFEYRDPEAGFNRSAVKGCLATLLNVKHPKYAAALEVVAGGKLYQIVVDNEHTAKKLLEKGDLKRRVTFIPLNKIHGGKLQPAIVQKAKHLVGDNEVEAAMDLVEFDDELEGAMAYVFGSSFVCNSLDAARKVTFNKDIMKKSVTLDGNSFDPAGLASGGAQKKTQSVLVKVAELKQKKQQLNASQKELSKLDQELKQLQTLAGKWMELTGKLDMAKKELQMLHEKQKNSAFGQQLQEIEDFKNQIAEMEKAIEGAKKNKMENEKNVKEFEENLKDSEGHKRRMVKAAEDLMAKCKKEAEQSEGQLEKMQQDCKMLHLELEDLEKEQVEANSSCTNLTKAIQSTANTINKLQSMLASCNEKVKSAQEKMEKQKELLMQSNMQVEEKSTRLKNLCDQIGEDKLKIEDIQEQFNEKKKLIKETEKKLERLMQKAPWIEDEKKNFNVEGGNYDFSAKNNKNVEREIQKLEEVKNKLSKDVNTRAMSMLEKVEQEHKDVLEKRPIVDKDLDQIKSVVHKLDLEKQNLLKDAVAKINKDFGSIFSTLLPGASAKLISSFEGGILTGVEFKIGFGGLWKESLAELSGGQRSLIALSFILSLLLFKPAPLYILDEVDAALDLSHTQNIGQMLKAHFKHSQFIIVSLKEGMFNNANVLFRTRFSDGISSVKRVKGGEGPKKKY